MIEKFKSVSQPADSRGVILVGILIIILFFSIAAVALAEFSMSHYAAARRSLAEFQAVQAAEAGGDHFMYNINQNSDYQGTTNAPSTATDSCTGYTSTPVKLADISGSDGSIVGKSTYETCVKNGSIPGEKIVYATGKIYLPASAAQPTVTRKIELAIGSTQSPGYSVQTGPAGLIMSNTSIIANGDVYLGGKLRMSNTSQIGTLLTPAEIWVGNNACPATGAGYPSTCSENQLGVIGQDTQTGAICLSNFAHIWGAAHVVNQGTTCSSSAITNPGIVDSTVPNVSLPPDNRSELNGANYPATTPGSNGSCSSGTRTWNANTHFTGDVEVRNSCVVYVKGDIWIDGKLELKNSASIIVDPSVAEPPTIAIDGKDGFKPSNSSSLAVNASGIGFEVITYYAEGAACSPGCTDATISGSELRGAQGIGTIETQNSFSALGSKLYARWSKILIRNSVGIGSIIGQTVELNNSGVVTFGGISSGSSGQWDIKHYRQYYQ